MPTVLICNLCGIPQKPDAIKLARFTIASLSGMEHVQFGLRGEDTTEGMLCGPCCVLIKEAVGVSSDDPSREASQDAIKPHSTGGS